jgi:hypothetical protein
MRTPASIAEAERLLESGGRLTSEQLAYVLEYDFKRPLSLLLRWRVINALRQHGKKRRRGPAPKTDAASDFARLEMRERYEEYLAKFREADRAKRANARKTRSKLPKAEAPAHERALKVIQKEYQREHGRKISLKRLSNLLYGKLTIVVPDEDNAPPDPHDPPDHVPARRKRPKRKVDDRVE